MNKIIAEDSVIIRKQKPGEGIFSFEIGPFSKTKSIKPGQFVHLQIPGCGIFFRRAFSVYDTDPTAGTIEILFKIFGRGTAAMAGMKKGDRLNILGPLGNGFTLPSNRETVILAGGGIGMPPLYMLAKRLVEKNYDKTKIVFFYGAMSKNDLADVNKIKKLGVKLFLSTDDGSAGYGGFVTDAIQKELSKMDGPRRLYACGPEGMLRAVDKMAVDLKIPGQLSLEAPMPCGIGICLGCIKPLVRGGNTRVCRDGPVYDVGEVVL